MPGEKHTFETARIRLEEIAAEVRKKDTSLEKSLDLLEEGVRLANVCTELVDHTGMSEATSAAAPEAACGDPSTIGVATDDEPPASVPDVVEASEDRSSPDAEPPQASEA